MRIFLFFLLILFIGILASQPVDYPHTSDNGGGEASAGRLKNRASIGQNVSGSAESSSLVNQAGFLSVAKTLPDGFYENPDAEKPENFRLLQNKPNPFNSTTIIEFHVPEDAEVCFKIYDLMGNVILEKSEYKKSGSYSTKIDATEMSSGLYLYSISTENFTEYKKMILNR